MKSCKRIRPRARPRGLLWQAAQPLANSALGDFPSSRFWAESTKGDGAASPLVRLHRNPPAKTCLEKSVYHIALLTRFLPQISLRNLRKLDCYANRYPPRIKSEGMPRSKTPWSLMQRHRRPNHGTAVGGLAVDRRLHRRRRGDRRPGRIGWWRHIHRCGGRRRRVGVVRRFSHRRL
jgi:hypothetical protein